MFWTDAKQEALDVFAEYQHLPVRLVAEDPATGIRLPDHPTLFWFYEAEGKEYGQAYPVSKAILVGEVAAKARQVVADALTFIEQHPELFPNR
jgi:hypothetical protein